MVSLLIALGLYVVGVGLFMVSRRGLETAYIQGKRDGLKDAVETAKLRGDTAVLCAPEGALIPMAVVRAQAAHQIEMDLRAELARVR